MTNWTEYNESLRRRADITVWFDESVKHQWGVGPTGKRCRPGRYSDFAITVTLQIRTVFHLALRQVQGFVRSLFKLMQFELAVPDFSTLSRRTSRLAPLPREGSKAFGSLDLVVDSTGLKVIGAGD